MAKSMKNDAAIFRNRSQGIDNFSRPKVESVFHYCWFLKCTKTELSKWFPQFFTAVLLGCPVMGNVRNTSSDYSQLVRCNDLLPSCRQMFRNSLSGCSHQLRWFGTGRSVILFSLFMMIRKNSLLIADVHIFQPHFVSSR